jgi:hypothetical protein
MNEYELEILLEDFTELELEDLIIDLEAQDVQW